MTPAEADRPPVASKRDFYFILTGIIMVLLLSSLSQGVVVTALPQIGRAVGDSALLPWVMTAYLLASTVVIPLFGKLADLIGRRRVAILALGLFIGGSVLCALAPSMIVLIAARALQGAGGGALTTLTATTLSDIVPPRERPRYQPLFLIFYLGGSLSGPVLGGILVGLWGWRSTFWMNLPLGLAALAVCSAAFRRLPHLHRPGRLDIEGALLLSVATIGLLMAISGDLDWPWAAAMLAGAVATTAIFVRWILRSPAPLIPLHVLFNPLVRDGALAAGLCGGAFVALTVYVPFYFQYGFHMTPSQSGAALVLPLLGSAVGSMVAGQLMSRMKRYLRVAIVGLVMGAGALAALAVGAWREATLPWIETLLVLDGIGVGACMTVAVISSQNAAPPADMGATVAVTSFGRQLGSAITVAVFGSILARAGMEAIIEGEAAFGHAIHAGFTWVCVGAMAMNACALIFVLRMENRPLRGGEDPSPDN